MAKRGAADRAEEMEAAKIMEDGHPDPTRLGFWATADEICRLNLQDHYSVYGYRTEPEHVKEQDPASAFVTTLPLTIADIAKQYGGYKWTLQLNRRTEGKSRKVHEVRFEVKDPPILQPHEQLVPAPVRAASLPANGAGGGAAVDQLVGLLGKQLEDLTKAKEKAEAEGREFNPSEALSKSIELMETGFQHALKSTQASGGGNNELLIAMMNNQSQQMIALINAMGSKKEDPLTAEIIKSYFAERNNPKQSAEETSVNTAISLIREIRSEFGRSGSSGKGADYADVLLKVADKLPEAAERVTMAVMRSQPAAAAVPGRPAIVERPAPLPAPSPGRVQSITANPAVASNAKTEAAADPGADSSPGAAELEQAQKFLWTLIKGKMVQKLTQGAEIEGDSAGTEAAFVCNEISSDAAKIMAKLFRDIPAHPDLLDGLKADPILGQAFNNPKITQAELMQFATDYVEWFEGELDEPEPAAPPVNPAQAAAPETVPAS